MGLALGAFVRVTGTTDVKAGHGIVAAVNGKTFAVFNVDTSSTQWTTPVFIGAAHSERKAS
jgi:hypothetical protein